MLDEHNLNEQQHITRHLMTDYTPLQRWEAELDEAPWNWAALPRSELTISRCSGSTNSRNSDTSQEALHGSKDPSEDTGDDKACGSVSLGENEIGVGTVPQEYEMTGGKSTSNEGVMNNDDESEGTSGLRRQ